MRLFFTFCIGFIGFVNILLSQNYIETKNGRLLFQSNTVHFSSFRAPANQTNTIHYVLPRNPPLAGEALVFDNSGELIWKNVSASAGDIGSGTPASGTFTSLSANNNFSVFPTGTSAGSTGQVRWYELAANGTNYTAFKAADAMASNVIYTLPSADGSSGNILTTNGSGTLSWTSTVTGSNVSASGNLTVNGNSALGDANTDITSLKGSLRVFDTDASNYTDIKGPNGAAQSSNLNFILPTNAGSSNNMLITDGSGNLSWSSAVNGSNVTASGDLAVGGNTTLGDGSGDITSLYGSLRVYDTDGSHYTDIKGGNGAIQAANLNFILPTDAGSNGKVLTTNGSGALSWTTPSPDWSAPGAIGSTTPNTGAFTTLSASGAMSLQPTGTGAGNTGEIRWYELAANGTNYSAFKAADAMAANVIYTLPSADGSSGNMLTTNGSGVLSWSSSVNTTNVTASGNLAVNGNTALGDANTDVTSLKGSLRVFDTDATHYTEIKGPDGTAQTANLNFILPTNGGSANNMLITDGSGNLSWSSSVNTTNVTASGDLAVGGNTALGNGSGDITSLTGTFRVYDSDATNYTDIKGGNGGTQTANLDFILPTNAGSSGNVLTTNGSGTLSWATPVPNWSAPGAIGSTTPNTGAFTTLSASGALSASGNVNIQPTGSGAGNTGEIRWYELAANGTNYTAFKAADVMGGNVTYTLPAADGTNGQFLKTNGSGVLSWTSPTASNEVLIYDPTGDHYSKLMGAEQTQNITYVYPPDPPVAINQSMIATNISGSTVTLGWSAGTGSTLYRTYQKNNTAVSTGNNNSSWILIPNISVTLDKNTQYAFEAIIMADCANGNACNTDIEIYFDGPTGAVYDALFTFPVGTTSGGYLHDITNYYDARPIGIGSVFVPTSELDDNGANLLTYKVRGYLTTSSDNTNPFKMYFKADGSNLDLRVQKAYVTFDRW